MRLESKAWMLSLNYMEIFCPICVVTKTFWEFYKALLESIFKLRHMIIVDLIK